MDEQKIKQQRFEYMLGKGVCVALLALAAILASGLLVVLLVFMLAGVLSGSTFAVILAMITFGLGYATYRIFSKRQSN